MRQLVGTTAAAGIAVVIAAVIVTSTVSARAPQFDVASFPTSSPTDPYAGIDVESIVSVLESDYPDVWSGVEASDHMLTVYRVSGVGLDLHLSERFPDVDFRFVDSRYSKAQLQDVEAAIIRDVEMWRTKGVFVNRVTMKTDGSSVEIGVDASSGDASQVEDWYGSDIVSVIEEGALVLL